MGVEVNTGPMRDRSNGRLESSFIVCCSSSNIMRAINSRMRWAKLVVRKIKNVYRKLWSKTMKGSDLLEKQM
jgi:hypothetical protein